MNERLNEFRQHQYIKQQFAAITPCANKTAKQYKGTIKLLIFVFIIKPYSSKKH
jgi:hypothetical protein